MIKILSILILVYLLLSPLLLLSQNNSLAYLEILKSDNLSICEKEQQVDHLFLQYQKNKQYESLMNDSFDYAKWYYRNGVIGKAIETNARALQLMDSLGVKDLNLYRKLLHNAGFYFNKNNEFKKARDSYKKLSKIDFIDELIFKAYHLCAYNTFLSGDYYLASEEFKIAIKFSLQHANAEFYIRNCLDASINYKRINSTSSLKAGIEVLESAISYTERIVPNSSKINDALMYSLYDQLGNLFSDREDYDFINSKINYDKALKIALRLKNPNILAGIYNDLGNLYLHSDKVEAFKYLTKALEFHGLNETQSIIHRNLSRYYKEVNMQDQALNHARQSINVLINEQFANKDDLPKLKFLYSCDNKYLLLLSIIEIGKIWNKFAENSSNPKDKYQKALNSFMLADNLVDIIRLESNEIRSKFFWRETATEIYLNGTKASFHLKNPEEGFYFMEKNKTLLILEDVAQKQFIENSVISESILKRQSYLKNQVLLYNKLSSEEDIQNDSISQLALNSLQNYSDYLDSLGIYEKFSFKSQRPVEIISLNYLRKGFKSNNEAYLEYILDDKEGYGIVITNHRLKFFEISNFKELKEEFVNYCELLKRPFKSRKDIIFYRELSNRIYSCLFPKGLEELIKNKILVIIPDNFLQYLPFEALQTSVTSNSYLILNQEISYAYSVSFLYQNNKIKRKNKNQFIGFAPVSFNSNLSELPNSNTEVLNASKYFNSHTFLNQEATKANFVQHIRNHDIIHIASHAKASDSIMPWIALRDKKIDLQELYTLENSAQLVVLSACESSTGLMFKGEGVMSLSRAFFNTGSNSVLSTLWEVNDKVSLQIMSDFYKNLKSGKTKSKALRDAKIKYIKSHSLSDASPYYWASAILIGNTDSIPQKGLNHNIVLFILFLIFSSAILLTFKIKN